MFHDHLQAVIDYWISKSSRTIAKLNKFVLKIKGSTWHFLASFATLQYLNFKLNSFCRVKIVRKKKKFLVKNKKMCGWSLTADANWPPFPQSVSRKIILNIFCGLRTDPRKNNNNLPKNIYASNLCKSLIQISHNESKKSSKIKYKIAKIKCEPETWAWISFFFFFANTNCFFFIKYFIGFQNSKTHEKILQREVGRLL